MSTTTPLPLAGKSALVTGAARSIGAEIALTLARRGAKVVVHYRSRDTEANQTVDAIREMGVEAVAEKRRALEEHEEAVILQAEATGLDLDRRGVRPQGR